jgi:hypothetical protein
MRSPVQQLMIGQGQISVHETPFNQPLASRYPFPLISVLRRPTLRRLHGRARPAGAWPAPRSSSRAASCCPGQPPTEPPAQPAVETMVAETVIVAVAIAMPAAAVVMQYHGPPALAATSASTTAWSASGASSGYGAWRSPEHRRLSV